MDNLLSLFSVIPNLVKEKAPEKREEMVPDESIETSPDSILDTSKVEEDTKLFVLKKEFLTSSSKIIQQDVHRKMFNDCFVNFLKNQARLISTLGIN